MTKPKTGVPAKAEGTAVVGAHDYGTQTGEGFEGTTGDELAIPWLNILQSNSPQVEDKTIKGAETGRLHNSQTNELYGGYGQPGLIVVPVKREQSFVEWIDREKGGGFVARHEVDSDIVKAAITAAGGGKVFGKLELENSNHLVQTFYVYVLILDEKGMEQVDFAIVAFNSTKIGPYKNWWTAMLKLKGGPPLYANRARLGTFPRPKQEREIC